MAVDISNGGLNFGSSLDPTGFLRGANIIEQSNARLISALDGVARRSNEVNTTMAKNAREAANGFSVLDKAIIGTFTAASIGGFISKMVQVRGQFQQINSAFATMLGSKEKADKLMAEATKLAATTPFSLTDVASGAKQLLAYGFGAEQITKNLTSLGNIAAGVGAPLNDIVYLYGTLKASGRVTQMDINQFAGRGVPIYEELAKVMGVTTDAVRGLVSSGKVGFPQIEQAFNNMTGEGGKFFNLMQEQSKSLTGQISNLGDAFDRMLNEIGQSNEGILSGGIQAAISLVENYKDVLDILGVLIATYGAYKVAVIVTTIAMQAQALGVGVLELASVRLNAITKILNGTMLANPYVLTATALAALVSALYLFSDSTSASEKAQKALNDVTVEANKQLALEKNNLSQLLSIAKNENLSKERRLKAISDINKLSPEYLGNISLETVNTQSTTQAIEDYTKALAKSIKLKALNQKLEETIKAEQEGPSTASLIMGDFGKLFGGEDYSITFARENKAAIKTIEGEIKKTLEETDKAVSAETKKTPRNKAFYEEIVKRNTEDLAGLDKTSKEFYAKSTVYKKKINDAKKELLAFDTTDKAGVKSAKIQENYTQKRIDLINKISEAEKLAFAASLGQNEREIAENKAKYQAMLNEIIAFNKKAPANKRIGKDVVQRVKNLADTEEKSIIYKQQTAQQSIEFEKQKKLYADYEAYKTSFGKEAAEKRYGNEVKTNAELLRRLKQQASGFAAKAAISGLNANEKTRFEQLVKQIQELDGMEQKRFVNAIQAAQTYVQKAAQIDADFQQQKQDLFDATNGKATEEQYKILEEQKNAKLRALNEENAYAQSGYADLMENMLGMTKAAVLERLAIIKQGYENNKTLTPKQKETLVSGVDAQISKLDGSENDPFAKAIKSVKEYKKAVRETKNETVDTSEKSKAMFGSIGGAIDATGQIFGEVTGALAGLGIGTDKYTQATLSSIQGLLGGMGDLAKGLASGNPVDIIKGAITMLTKAIELFNTKDKKLERQIDGYKANLASLQKSYEELGRAVQNSVGDSYYSDSAAQIENLKRQQQELIKARDAESEKKKSDQAKIDDYNNQIDAIPGKIEDINNAISQNLIQGTFKDLSNALADALTDAFKSGEDGLAAMDKSFNAFIGNAIKNSLKLKLIEPIIKSLTDDLIKYAKGNGNSVVGFDFSSYKADLQNAGKTFTDALDANKEFFQGTANKASDNTLSGQIKGITETQANVLEGALNGMRLAHLQTNEILRPMALNAKQLLDLAVKNLETVVKIELNTKRSADASDNYLPFLKDIALNTKDTLATQLRAAGKYGY